MHNSLHTKIKLKITKIKYILVLQSILQYGAYHIFGVKLRCSPHAGLQQTAYRPTSEYRFLEFYPCRHQNRKPCPVSNVVFGRQRVLQKVSVVTVVFNSTKSGEVQCLRSCPCKLGTCLVVVFGHHGKIIHFAARSRQSHYIENLQCLHTPYSATDCFARRPTLQNECPYQ